MCLILYSILPNQLSIAIRHQYNIVTLRRLIIL